MGDGGFDSLLEDVQDGIGDFVDDPVGTITDGVSAAVSDPGSVVDGVVETLQELVIDEVTIDSILEALGNAEQSMPGRKEIRRVHGRAFGTLPAGEELGTHAGKADEFVLESMLEMLTTLGVYVDGVKSFRQGANAADEFSAAQLRRITEATTHGRNVNDRQGNRGDQ